MAKQLNVNLAFNADVSKAKTAIQSLQQAMDAINASIVDPTLPLTKGVQEATQAASILQSALNNALNVDTGKFDFNKFNTTLKSAGISLETIHNQLLQLGPDGQRAFIQMADAIVQMESPVARVNAKLTELGTVFKNTLKWQITSSLLHGFMGAVSEALKYTKDLNKSLNDIRRVSKASADDMEVFATKASKTAKILNTTTNEYAKAALIYYQQGLSSAEVEDRTAITIKMANAAGESADKVSQQLTAVWNNFYDGSKSLEYYADVMTALGAATASSTDEISEGLEKFASVAETVGLSYEYATSALATVTATTRQSADVVGTAFKTLFARIQDLEQGDTLDDGTTLGKYSNALMTIGVNIKDTTGNLKNMDSILDEVGTKWGTLSSDAKMALAQTLAGIRQYTQFIALMDNWDFFEENVALAKSSTGELERQNAIYAQSWEAARDRISAAIESVYNKILDDDFFITILDAGEKIITGIDYVIDRLGGLPGVLTLISSIIMKIFSKQITTGLQNFGYGIKSFLGFNRGEEDATKQMAVALAQDESQADASLAQQDIIQIKNVQDRLNLTNLLKSRESELTEIQKEQLKQQIQLNETRGEAVLSAQREKELAEQTVQSLKRQAELRIGSIQDKNERTIAKSLFSEATKEYEKQQKDAYKILNDSKSNNAQRGGAATKLKNAEQAYYNSLIRIRGITPKLASEIINARKKEIDATNKAKTATNNYNKNLRKLKDNIKNMPVLPKSYSEIFVNTAQGMTQAIAGVEGLASSIASLVSGKKSLENFFEVFTSALYSIPMLASGINTLKIGYSNLIGKLSFGNRILAQNEKQREKLSNILKAFLLDANNETAILTLKNTLSKKQLGLSKEEINSIITQIVAKKAKNKVSDKENAQQIVNSTLTHANTVARIKNAAAAMLQSKAGKIVLAGLLVLASGYLIVKKAIEAHEKAQRESAQADLKESNERATQIKNNQDLTKSIWDIVFAYTQLTKTGKSTYEQLENLKEQGPELIKSYRELAELFSGEQLSTFTHYLNQMEDFLDAGLITEFATALANAEAMVNSVSIGNAKSGAISGGETLALSDEAQGKVSGTKYKLNIGEVERTTITNANSTVAADRANTLYNAQQKVLNIVDEEMGDFGQRRNGINKVGFGFDVDLNDPSQMIQFYESMQKAKTRLVNELTSEELDNSDIYREINEELQAMASNYDSAKEAYDNYYNEIKITLNDSTLYDQGGKFEQFGGISSLDEYEAQREALIEKIKSEYGENIDVESLLRNITQFSDYERALSQIDIGTNALSNITLDKSIDKEKIASDLREFYDALSPEDKTLFLNVDFNNIDETTWEKQKLQIQEQMQEIFGAQQEASDQALVEKLDLDWEEVTYQAKNIQNELASTSEEYELTAHEARQLAIQNQLMNEGIQDLQKNWEDWETELKKGDKTTSDYVKTIRDLTKDIAKLIGHTEDLSLPQEFFDDAENLELIKKAVEGDIDAINTLGIVVSKELVKAGQITEDALQDINGSTTTLLDGLDGADIESKFDTLKGQILSGFDILQDAVDSKELKPGQSLVNAFGDEGTLNDWVTQLNKYIQLTGMTKDQVNDLLSDMGVSANVTVDQVVTTREIPLIATRTYTSKGKDDEGKYTETYEKQVDTGRKIVSSSVMEVPSISMGDNEPEQPTIKFIGNGKASATTTGGGGGSKDSYQAPDNKEYKDEIERYHVIKQKIGDLQEAMDHLAKAKERAFGTSKLELMDQEIEKYNEMIDLQNQYLDEINKYWEEDKALIASYGAEFDETGVITNYDEIMKRQIDKYNSSIGKNEEADEAAEEAYDDFIEALEQYEETNNLRQDELEKLYDLQTELADVIFEKTQYKIEIKIAVKDDELEYLDYLLSKIEDDAYSAAEAIALIGEKAENALEKTKTYSDGLMELLSNHGINSIEELDKLTVDDLKAKNFTEDEIDQIREWRSSILEANQELLEMRATIQEKVLDSFNQFSEDIQDQIDLFEHYQNILEGVKDITSLLGAQLNEQSKLVLRNLNRSLINNSINNLAGAKQQVETLKQMRANAQEQYDKAVANEDSIGIKQWSDTLKEIDDQVHSAEENFLDTWQEALERARDIFEEEMDNIVKEFEDGVSPIYGSIEALQDAITRANELNDQYLNDTDKTYELNKLRRQIEGSIDDTDIIPHKQALNKLQDELNKKLKDGSKISEYDLKILQSKYELELARQKLEDVQNSNETVRLTRDNNGNWGYVYSANEDKIAEAEQEYEDKLNAYQKANEEYLRTLENNIIQLQSDYQEKLTAIRLSFVEGEISQAEYEKQAADLEKYYNERMQQIHQQYEEVFKNSKDANEKFVAYYKDSSGALVENFNQTTLALQTGYQTLDEMFEKFWKSHDNYVADSNKLLDDYLNKIKEINNAAGIEGSFADAASGWSIKITGESDKAVADMEKIVKNATDSFNDVIKAASDWESIYVSKIDSAIKRNEALVKTMNEMVAALSGMNSIDYSKYENAIDSRSTATANNIISTQHNSESFNKTVEVPDYISQFSYLDMLDQLDMNKQIEDWMSNNELSIDTALMDSLDISTILQNIGLNVQTIVSYLSNLIPSSLGVDRIAQEFMQQVSINADFPNVTDSNEIMEAFEIMENEASQYANRKTI